MSILIVLRIALHNKKGRPGRHSIIGLKQLVKCIKKMHTTLSKCGSNPELCLACQPVL